ncbi:tetratricopeptide repeat protein [Bradyrhizobium sp. CB3481]|uniref:tetratricopeptide repeat protein n=1 Tax=Bradyrhizobium sp. CB3481 TaxID=3039158 RepID=UPI0024B13AEA|nr:tetratricopeptide repeat protein [Bradyrhizobium sp. CB3481]WFU15877.1 tetratricopeptide repeat protein [Bradyrhizobium sp. CB3481]
MEQRSQARVARARELLSIPRLTAAIGELDTAIADDPRNSAALLLRGRLKIQGRLDEAIADMDRVLQLDPDNSNAHATKAFALQGQNDEWALAEASKALGNDPRNADAFWIRASVLARVGKLTEAEQDLDAAIALEPDVSRTLLRRAGIRAQMGKADDAVRDASAVLALGPDMIALQLRAVIRGRSGDFAGAIDDLNAILGPPEEPRDVSVLPHMVDLYVQRALALTRTGQVAHAKRDLDMMIKLGGPRAVLQMQIYLRNHGFPDLALDGKRSDQFDDALTACFINDACGRGIAIPG